MKIFSAIHEIIKIKLSLENIINKILINSISSLYKCELLLQLFKNCGNYLKNMAIL